MPFRSDPSSPTWDPTFPTTLLVTCSDGRVSCGIEEFVRETLGVTRFDQLVVPGGGGALAPSGPMAEGGTQPLDDARFLIEAHRTELVVLFFHGPGPDGPPDAVCGGYRRRLPDATPEEIREQQVADALAVIEQGFGPQVRAAAYRCDVDCEDCLVITPLVEPADLFGGPS